MLRLLDRVGKTFPLGIVPGQFEELGVGLGQEGRIARGERDEAPRGLPLLGLDTKRHAAAGEIANSLLRRRFEQRRDE